MREKDVVIYNAKKKTYTKIIKPKLKKQLKYFFKLRRYPGENIKYIADIFNKNGIKTFEVLKYSKYMVVTKEIDGKSLMDEIINNNDKKYIKILIEKYIDKVKRIIELGVYFGDFNFGNFIVSNGELYAIDLEDYRKDFLTRFRRKAMMKRLKRELKGREEILNRMNQYINSEKIYQQIEKKINKKIGTTKKTRLQNRGIVIFYI
ncbi:BUD32 family EKC/KEOPS complex subunit [Fusobacterium ulcerans]